MRKIEIKNGSNKCTAFVDNNWESKNPYNKVSEIESFDFSISDIQNFAAENGEVVSVPRRWGEVHYLRINDKTFSMGHTNMRGKIKADSCESDDGIRSASDGVNTVNYEKSFTDCVNENMESMIEMFKNQ
jgi:hypothetical protein